MASTGSGDRRSRGTGAGIEFAEHHPYTHGDDLRHLDLHVLARHGRHVVKRYVATQQMNVVLLVDATRSMAHGGKFEMASDLAGVVAFAALNGGDRLQVGVFAGERVRWGPRVGSASGTGAVLDWLSHCRTGGQLSSATDLRASVGSPARPSLIVLVSDLQFDGVEELIGAWEHDQHETVLVHTLAADEEDPTYLGHGQARLRDMEAGDELEVALTASVFTNYREELRSWRDGLRDLASRRRGRYLFVSTGDDFESCVLNRWRVEEFLR